jgi:sec-independent protein translocase protein TatC
VVSQLLLALPTWVLFEFGVLMARLVERRNANNPSDADDEPQA